MKTIWKITRIASALLIAATALTNCQPKPQEGVGAPLIMTHDYYPESGRSIYKSSGGLEAKP